MGSAGNCYLSVAAWGSSTPDGEGERMQAGQKRLMMQDGQYREFWETVNRLFDLRKMEVDK